jgi:RNA polymerase sigma factor (sigma-70 family)
MTALPDWDMVSDAELACAAAAGDRGAFAGIYDRYADRLHDFCVGMLRDRDSAADCVQEVFCTAVSRLSQLRDGDKLRPWLYAIARNEALRCIRERSRERAVEQLPDVMSTEPGPDTLAARTELADLIALAAGGLSERDRAVLELSYRHALDGPDLAEALGVSRASAKKMTQRLRETIERSLGALLVSRAANSGPSGCAELAAILDGWDGTFTVLMRKRIARHIESCPTCDEQRRRLVNPVALLGGAPVFIPAPRWLRERTLGQVHLTPGRDRGRLSRHLLLTAALVAVLAGGLTMTIVRLNPHAAPASPANLTRTTTPSITAPMGPASRTAAATSHPASTGQQARLSSVPVTAPPSPQKPTPPSITPVKSTAPVTRPQPPSVNPSAPPSVAPVVPIVPVAPPQLPPVKPTTPPTAGPVTPPKPIVIHPPAPTAVAPAPPVTTQPVIG